MAKKNETAVGAVETMGHQTPSPLAPAHAGTQGVADVEIPSTGQENRAKPATLSDPGAVNRQVAIVLAQKFSPQLIAEKIGLLLEARRTVVVRSTEMVDGREKKVDTPIVEQDMRAMESGLKLLLAYMVGLPVQRQEVVQVNLDADSAVGLKERLMKSPALCEALKKMLVEAEESRV